MRTRPGWRGARRALVILTAIGGALAVPSSALAIQLITVNTTGDTPTPGKTTLRQAIAQANALSGSVEITLTARGTYQLTQCGPGTDTSNNEGNLTYYGSAQLTIEGNGNSLRQTCSGDRILLTQTSTLLNVNDLTLSGGDAANQPGGAIWSQGNGELDLKNDVFTENHSDAAGGGVAASDGKLVITGSTFVSNSATELAGAIASIGPVVIVNSTVSGNSGGLSAGSPANVGGVAASAGLTLIYSTVQDNTAQNLNIEQGGLVSYASVIGLSHPTPGAPSYPTCEIAGGTKSLGYDVSSDPSCGFGNGPGDRSSSNPDLRPEASPLGAFEAFPGPGSPLINAIPTSACFPAAVVALVPEYASLTFDQFGTKRPQGSGCDIGALEVPFPVGRIHHSRHPVAGQKVTFSGAGSTETNAKIVSYVWHFGDHSRAAHGRRVKHTFARPGRYHVKLTLVDSNGERTTVKQLVIVRA